MRRLSIATAHAFLLVYSTCSLASFECVKRCFEEVREQRADFQVNIRAGTFCFFFFIKKKFVYIGEMRPRREALIYIYILVEKL